MASTKQPPTGLPRLLRRRGRRGRRAVTLAVRIALVAAIVTGCTWLTRVTVDEHPGATPSASLAASVPPQDHDKNAAVGEEASSSTARTTADVASEEAAEVEARIAEASVDPGACGTVAYTPDTASSVQVGELCMPKDQTQSTIIVLVHGGGGTGGSRSDLASWQLAYSELGYATFSIDYRLTDAETDEQVWPEPEQDVKAAIQFVRLADSALGGGAIVVQGHSAGARLGGVILTTPDDPAFQGPELWTEASDAADGFIGFYGYYNGFQFEWDAYYGDGADSPEESQALANAGQASGPALLITGSDDSMIDAAESTEFAAALDATGGDGETIVLEGRDHSFDQQNLELTADGSAMLEEIQWWIADRFGWSRSDSH